MSIVVVLIVWGVAHEGVVFYSLFSQFVRSANRQFSKQYLQADFPVFKDLELKER